MKYFAFAVFTLGLFASASTAIAAETYCKGDALQEKPPVPNYPYNIRNIVWRNMRLLCLQELSQTTKSQTSSNTTSTPSALTSTPPVSSPPAATSIPSASPK